MVGLIGEGRDQPLGLRDIGKPGSVTTMINEMYKKKTGTISTTRGAGDAGAVHAGGSHQPGRIDGTGKDPGSAEGDRSQAEPADDGLSRREIRREGQQQPGLDALLIQIQGDRYVAVWPRRTAGGAAGASLQGLVRACTDLNFEGGLRLILCRTDLP